MDYWKHQLIIWCVLPLIACAATSLVIGIAMLWESGASISILTLGGATVVVLLFAYYTFGRWAEEPQDDANELRSMLMFSLNQPVDTSLSEREFLHLRNIIVNMMYIPDKLKVYFYDLSSEARQLLQDACLGVIEEKEAEMKMIAEDPRCLEKYRELRQQHADLISIMQILRTAG